MALVAEPIQAQLSISIRTDKYTYQLGETVWIEISVSRPCKIKLTFFDPDRTHAYEYELPWAGKHYFKSEATYPIGRSTIRVDAQYDGYTASATTSFEIVGSVYTTPTSSVVAIPEYVAPTDVPSDPALLFGAGEKPTESRTETFPWMVVLILIGLTVVASAVIYQAYSSIHRQPGT